MKADTAIHDESGLFVEEFVAKTVTKSDYKYIDLSLLKHSSRTVLQRTMIILLIPNTTNIGDLKVRSVYI
jgi:ABC-2 type transport system permease protein